MCLLYIFLFALYFFVFALKSFVSALFCLYLLGIFVLVTFCKCHLSMWSNISWMMFCTTRYWSIVSWGFTDWGMSTGSTLQVGCVIDDIYDNIVKALISWWPCGEERHGETIFAIAEHHSVDFWANKSTFCHKNILTNRFCTHLLNSLMWWYSD